jgi:hypothetical protein
VPLIPAATYTFSPGTTILSAEVNANFAALRSAINSSVVFADVATSITAAHTYSALQTYSAGVTISAGNLSVAGTSTLTGAVTAPGGITGALTGNASTATALATARAFSITGDVTAAGVNFDGTGVVALEAAIAAGVIVNADVNASAAIAYSKLALTGSIVNADVGASAAIAYSKLALTGSIVNADISASASIAASKLATVTVAKGGTGLTATPTNGQLLIGNGSGYTLATITAGSNITVTNGSGTIEIAASGGGGGGLGGSGTVGTIAKFVTDTVTLGNSLLTESGTVVTVGGSLSVGTGSMPSSGQLRLANNTYLVGRTSGSATAIDLVGVSSGGAALLASGSGNVLIGTSSASVSIAASGTVTVGALVVSSTLAVNALTYMFPGSHGSSGYVLTNNGSGTLSWSAPSGGISGLTTGTIPKAASSTTLGDSILTESGTALSVGGSLSASSFLNGSELRVSSTKVVGARSTGWGHTFQNTAAKAGSTGGIQNAPSTIDGAAPLSSVQDLEALVRAIYDALLGHGLIGA